MTGFRRLLVTLILGLAGATAVHASDGISVDVQSGSGEGYTVVAGFEVAASRETVWEVLTDYEGIATFVSSIRESTIRRREPGRVTLEQRGVGRAWIVSVPMHVILDVREYDQTALTFRDLCGKSFSTYEGQWQLTPQGAATRVTYRLNAEPNGRQPAMLARSVIRGSVSRLVRELRAEIERRAHPGASK